MASALRPVSPPAPADRIAPASSLADAVCGETLSETTPSPFSPFDFVQITGGSRIGRTPASGTNKEHTNVFPFANLRSCNVAD
jgi:hypothetical protein